ncbi:MAG: DNA mismatch repair protein MutL, partial [Ruminococcus sp.]|nr:DNA mismatch repair protein MutL [Ruminococcus sp.]
NKLIYETVFFSVKNTLLHFDKPNELKLDNHRKFTDKELYVFPPDTSKNNQLQFTVAEKKSEPQHQFNQNTIDFNKQTPKIEYEKPAETVESISQPSQPPTNVDLKTIEPESKKTDFNTNDTEFKYITKEAFTKNKTVVVDDIQQPKQNPVVIGELFKTYIVAQVGDEMLLIDKHAAHERYIFEQIKNDADQLDTQMYLEPIMVLLSYEEYDALSSNLDKIAKLGFSVEPDVAPTVAVKGVPLVLGNENPSEIITELAENFIKCRHNPQLKVFDELFHSIACKSAIKANDDSDIIELQALVNSIYENDAIRYCPHGRPVMIKLSKRDIEKQFKRIV